MRVAIVASLFLTIWAPAVLAGAWLREHKSVFTAIGVTVRTDMLVLETENKFYLEYGLSRRVTLGLDYNEIPGQSGHALAFFRLPLGPTDRPARYAVELGLGKHHLQGERSNMYKFTLAFGRGFESRWGNGWVGVEAAYEQRT